MTIQVVHELPTIESRVVGIDIETSSTYGNKISNPFQDRIISIQVYDGQDVYIIEPRGNMHSVLPLVNNPEIKKVGHGLIFDLSFLIQQLGADPVNVYDTLILDRMIYAGMKYQHGLEDSLARIGVFITKDTRSQFASHRGDLTAEQIQYCAGDVEHLLKLREVQVKEICSTGMGRVAAIENKAVLPFADMSLAGVRFDSELWEEDKRWIEKKLNEIKREIAPLGGFTIIQEGFMGEVELDINLNSTKQLPIAFERLGIPLKTTAEDVLEEYIQNHPNTSQSQFLSKLLEWKKWSKMLGWKFIDEVNPVTGRIHASWNQLQAQTGRTSCKDPNLQQIPKPTGVGPNFRHLFAPPEGWVFVIADYAQQEFRIIGQFTGDANLIKACNAGDVYLSVAEMVFNQTLEKGSKERYDIKTSALGWAYGAGANTLANSLGRSVEDATKFKQQLSVAFPKVRAYSEDQKRKVIQQGYTTTLMGRRRYFPDAKKLKPEEYWKVAKEAANSPIQGTAADMGKLAMIKFREYYWKQKQARPMIYVHDEFVVGAPIEDAEETLYNLVGAMESAAHEICPDVIIPAESGIAKTWDKV